MDLGERGSRFILTAHPFENIGEQKVLSRVVGLAGDRSLLNFECVLEAILAHIQERDLIERFGVVNIEFATGSVFLEDPGELRVYEEVWSALQASAITP